MAAPRPLAPAAHRAGQHTAPHEGKPLCQPAQPFSPCAALVSPDPQGSDGSGQRVPLPPLTARRAQVGDRRAAAAPRTPQGAAGPAEPGLPRPAGPIRATTKARPPPLRGSAGRDGRGERKSGGTGGRRSGRRRAGRRARLAEHGGAAGAGAVQRHRGDAPGPQRYRRVPRGSVLPAPPGTPRPRRLHLLEGTPALEGGGGVMQGAPLLDGAGKRGPASPIARSPARRVGIRYPEARWDRNEGSLHLVWPRQLLLERPRFYVCSYVLCVIQTPPGWRRDGDQ